MVELIVPIALVALLVVAWALTLRLLATWMLHRTIRDALKSDPGSVKLLAARLEARQPWTDGLLGWILIAFAVGLVLVSLFEDFEERRQVMQGALVPALVGVTVLIYVRVAERRNEALRKN